MNSKRDLTDFPGQPNPAWNVVELLDDAGLELWQAPEGFWAIRVKRASVTSQSMRLPRKRRLEGRA